jgi:ribose 5-phosphate isomerase B
MNKANVLVMSLRATSPEVAKEILDAWFAETVRPEEAATIDQLKEIEARHAPK